MTLPLTYISCGAVVTHHGKVLLVRDTTGTKWGLSMGEPDLGESEEQTAIREIREETGLAVTIVPGFSKTAQFKYLREGTLAEKHMVIFLARSSTDAYKPNTQEIAHIGWFTPQEAMKLDIYPEAKEIISQAIKHP